MKKLLFICVFMLFAVSLWAIQNPWDIKLPFKEATIYYQIDSMQKGSATLYVKDYGKKSAMYREAEMKFLGMAKKDKTLTITTPDWVYEIDLMEMTGTKQVNPQKYLIEEFNKLSRSDKKKLIKNSEELSMSMLGTLNGTMEKKAAKILGYTCDKVTAAGMVVYTIAGTPLPLKTEGNMMGIKYNETAIKIEKGSVPSSKFKIPEGVEITHDKKADEFAKVHAKETIKYLLEGKRPPETQNKAVSKEKKQQKELTPEEQDAVKKLMQIFGGSQN